MNRLLELLINPNHRVPLETLLKCENALEKMDFKNNFFVAPGAAGSGAGGAGGGGHGAGGAHGGGSKELLIGNMLMEAVGSCLQSPMGNHSLQRTFRPCIEAIFGADIK